jgi:hypothetical protein
MAIEFCYSWLAAWKAKNREGAKLPFENILNIVNRQFENIHREKVEHYKVKINFPDFARYYTDVVLDC